MEKKDKCLSSFPKWVKARVNLALNHKHSDICNWYLEEFIDHNNYDNCLFKAWYLTTTSLISLCLSFDQINMIEYFKKDIIKIETVLNVLEDKCTHKEIVCTYSIKMMCVNGDIIKLSEPEVKRAEHRDLYMEFIEAFKQSF